MRTLANYFAKYFFVAILLLPLLVSACGYRGPLYLPDDAQAEQMPDAAEIEPTGNLPATDGEDDEDGDSDL